VVKQPAGKYFTATGMANSGAPA